MQETNNAVRPEFIQSFFFKKEAKSRFSTKKLWSTANLILFRSPPPTENKQKLNKKNKNN